jgi:hypothetical protein
MGIDIHIGEHYFSFRVPPSVLVLVALIALVGVWKLGRVLLVSH